MNKVYVSEQSVTNQTTEHLRDRQQSGHPMVLNGFLEFL